MLGWGVAVPIVVLGGRDCWLSALLPFPSGSYISPRALAFPSQERTETAYTTVRVSSFSSPQVPPFPEQVVNTKTRDRAERC